MDNFERLPSNNIPAEQAVLGAMMSTPQAIEDVTEIVGPADFFRPLHQDIFMAMVAMFSCNEPVTPHTLRAWLERDKVRFDPLYLVDLYSRGVPGAMAAAHARLVWECSVRRKMEETGTRLAQMAIQLDVDMSELIDRGLEQLTSLATHATPEDDGALSLNAFMALKTDRTAPVIPGLLDHQDRVVVVGGEGDGKTELAFQVGLALICGQHPFTRTQIPPGRVVICDLENPETNLQRRLRRLIRIADQFAGWTPGNLAIWAKPGGIDLTKPRDAFKLADVIRKHKPDLVIVGPLYKAGTESEDGSTYPHAQVCKFFDQMRERHGCAVWLETHAPMSITGGKRSMRPLGSGIWSRWPEFGIALSRNGKTGGLLLERFRGDREEGRSWPEKIERNRTGAGWPWTARYPDGFFDQPLGGEL